MKKLLAIATVLLGIVPWAARGEGTNQVSLLPGDLEKKLGDIVIPEVHWKSTPLKEAVAFLNKEAQAADPGKVGVPIVLKTSAEISISFSTKKSSLKFILSSMCKLAGLTMTIEDGKIILTKKGKAGAEAVPDAPVF